MKNNLSKVLVLIITLSAILYLFLSPSRYVGYSPEQPIPFNHKVHAGDNKIDCRYCHLEVENARHSTVPPTAVCMNCHQLVAKDSPSIKWLTDKYNKNEPIEWVKVHDLPDHAYFDHSRHINSGVDCSTCHGNVAEMEKITQKKSLNMGFCVDCHRENNAPYDCSTCHR